MEKPKIEPLNISCVLRCQERLGQCEFWPKECPAPRFARAHADELREQAVEVVDDQDEWNFLMDIADRICTEDPDPADYDEPGPEVDRPAYDAERYR